MNEVLSVHWLEFKYQCKHYNFWHMMIKTIFSILDIFVEYHWMTWTQSFWFQWKLFFQFWYNLHFRYTLFCHTMSSLLVLKCFLTQNFFVWKFSNNFIQKLFKCRKLQQVFDPFCLWKHRKERGTFGCSEIKVSFYILWILQIFDKCIKTYLYWNLFVNK